MKKKAAVLFMVALLSITGCSRSDTVSLEDRISFDTRKTKEEQQSEDTENSGETNNPEDGHYSWQEMSIILPEGWQERCVIVENEAGFSIYQKASYEQEEGMGYICGFERGNELLMYGAGETLMAYTDDGTLYYMFQPTDFPCDTSQKDLVDEYTSMCEQVDEIKASLEIEASNLHWDAGEYILPTSSILALDGTELMNLSGNDLWIAKNEIYARHGRQFKNDYLQMYFERCSWYDGTIAASEFDESCLSQLEKDNLKLILAATDEYDKAHPYPKKYSTSDTAKETLSDSPRVDKIRYRVEEMGDWQYACWLTINGTDYYINDIVSMESPVSDVFYITDISETDDYLEIALLDEGPSDDPVTLFFRYDGTLTFLGGVAGFPFSEQTGGMNGFDGWGNITGMTRMDLIETAYLEGYWYLEDDKICEQTEVSWHNMLPSSGHTLYVDLPVYCSMDDTSASDTIPAGTQVYFLGSDMKEWILVRGKDGTQGYIHVKDGSILGLDQPADVVMSDLYFFD